MFFNSKLVYLKGRFHVFIKLILKILIPFVTGIFEMTDAPVTNLAETIYDSGIRGEEFRDFESTFENCATVSMAVSPIQDMLVWPANDAHNRVLLKQDLHLHSPFSEF